MDNTDFEIVETRKFDTEIVSSNEQRRYLSESTRNKIGDTVADNMGSIIDIAKDIVDIKRMQVQSDAVLKKLEADRNMLREQTNSYVEKKRADSKAQLDRMEKARLLLQDFYKMNDRQKGGITGEEFSNIIKYVLDCDGEN